jgi:hypothetical protein
MAGWPDGARAGAGRQELRDAADHFGRVTTGRIAISGPSTRTSARFSCCNVGSTETVTCRKGQALLPYKNRGAAGRFAGAAGNAARVCSSGQAGATGDLATDCSSASDAASVDRPGCLSALRSAWWNPPGGCHALLLDSCRAAALDCRRPSSRTGPRSHLRRLQFGP